MQLRATSDLLQEVGISWNGSEISCPLLPFWRGRRRSDREERGDSFLFLSFLVDDEDDHSEPTKEHYSHVVAEACRPPDDFQGSDKWLHTSV